MGAFNVALFREVIPDGVRYRIRMDCAKPSLTVAICTLDKCADLEICLESLRDQVVDGAWDVLVVDNGSTDGTAEYVDGLAAAYPVSLQRVSEPERGLSHARNRALAVAEGEVVLFVDDDVRFLPGCLDAHLRGYERQDTVATGGRITPSLTAEAPSWVNEKTLSEMSGPLGRCEYGDARLAIGPGEAVRSFYGGNMSMRRQVALDVGGFRVDLGWGKRRIPGEETELVQRLAGAGRCIWYLPEAALEHRVDPRRLTPARLRAWNLGSGRASVMIRPARNPLVWLGKTVEQLLTLLVRCPALLMGEHFIHVRTHRKFYQAAGRLAQLIHLP